MSVYRTIGPTLVLFLDYRVTKVTMVIDTNRFFFRIKLSYICIQTIKPSKSSDYVNLITHYLNWLSYSELVGVVFAPI